MWNWRQETSYLLWNEEAYPFLLPLPWVDENIDNNQWIVNEANDTIDWEEEYPDTAYWLWNIETYPWLLPLPWETTETSIDDNQWIVFEERDEYEALLDSDYEEVYTEEDFCDWILLVKI